jgi:hypothetical protein
MEAWAVENPAAYKARDNAKRFGMAVPPLSGVIALFAVIAMKIPLFGLVVVPLGATAVAAVLAVMSLPGELAAIGRYVVKVRNERAFPNREDEASVLRCAIAQAWDLALPPILRWLHK